MKLPPSTYFSKLFSALLPELSRSTLSSRLLFGTLLAFSLIVSIYHFQLMEQPFFNNHDASAQLDTSPLFANPGTDDFLSYAVAIMPTVQGANLDTSNIAATNCDLLVPVTYLDAGCMNSLPLLFPFEQQQSNFTEPVNQTVYSNFGNGSALDLSIGVASENITAGETQTVTVSVSDQNSTEPIAGAFVLANITDSFSTVLHEYSGTSDEVGQVSFPFLIPSDAVTDIYNVAVEASADGYENASASTTFEVVGSDFLFDNSTTDDFFDDGSSSSSDDNCCSSDDNNDDFDSPTVKSVDPNDNQNNVALNTEIKVTFDEKMDENTLDDGSLNIFNLDTGVDPDVNANPSSKEVTYTLDRQLEPGTRYEAELDFNIEDDNGNFLDCSNSNDVDSSCRWQFETTTTSDSADITLSPNSGSVLTSVDVSGTGFAPLSSVTITFDDATVAATTTTSTGTFFATFNIPLSSSIGDHSVEARQGPNTAAETFEVTSLLEPIIDLDPNNGTAGTSVDIIGAGFDPGSTVTITFNGTVIATSPATVTPSANGIFSASFTVPVSSSFGLATVIATQGTKSASEQFLVTDNATSLSTNRQLSTNLSNVSSIENPSNQSNASLAASPSNQSNASVSIFTNSSFDTVESNGTITIQNNTPSLNTSSSQSTENSSTAPTVKQMNDTSVIASTESNGTITIQNNIPSLSESATQGKENSSTAPTVKQMNDTSVISSTDNTINNNPPSSASTLSNDTSNSKKSSGKSTPISPLMSNDQREAAELAKDNTTNEIAQNESTNPLSDAKVKSKDISSKDSETASSDSVTQKPSTVTEDKTITKVKSPDNDNQAEKQSGSADSSARDRALSKNYLKYQESVKSQQKENEDESRQKVLSQDIAEVNNRPIAINDKATTESNIPVNINILRNDKDSDGDKLSIMGMSPPLKGKIETSSDGIITYKPLESWSGTERFGYSINDGRGGVASGSVTVIVQPAENRPPEAQDQDVTVNGNNPVKIKLGAKDPDDGKLRFVLDSKPSHGRIVQFSSSTGTLTYVPDENYNGKDDFSFKVHDGTVFSKDAKVSVKIENNEKLARDQPPQNDQQPKKDESNKAPTDEQKPNDQKSNSDTPPNDSNQQSSSSSQETEQKETDQKAEEQQSSEPTKPTSDSNTAPSGESQSNS